MHVVCVNALKLLSSFFWLFLGQGLAFFGEDRLATLPYNPFPIANVGNLLQCPDDELCIAIAL